MKKIFFTLLAVVSTLFSYAQRTVSVTATIDTPSHDKEYFTGDVIYPVYKVINLGPDKIAFDDSIIWHDSRHPKGVTGHLMYTVDVNASETIFLNTTRYGFKEWTVYYDRDKDLTKVESVIDPVTNDTTRKGKISTDKRYIWYFSILDVKTSSDTSRVFYKPTEGATKQQFVWLDPGVPPGTSIDEIFKNDATLDKLVVYPNPSNGVYKFDFTPFNDKTITARVVDMQGKVIKMKDYAISNGIGVKHTFEIDITTLPKGNYYLHLGGYGREASCKIHLQ
jgi:hypothetical protein